MFLATANDPAVRRAERRAVALAEEACRISGRKDPELLRTLTVAYAAAGRPRDAADTAGEAVALARSSGRHTLANEIAEELALTRSTAAGRDLDVSAQHIRKRGQSGAFRSDRV